MENILNICKNEYFMFGILIVNVIVILIFIINTIAVNKSKKAYNTLIKKLGKSNNIEELLNEYMKKSNQIEEDYKETMIKYKELKEQTKECIKKVGVVRYSAFKDVGSDLSFAVALLNDNNDGVVFNGIYSVENSNVYAKLIENGKSKYSISEEEQKAIDIAMNQ